VPAWVVPRVPGLHRGVPAGCGGMQQGPTGPEEWKSTGDQLASS